MRSGADAGAVARMLDAAEIPAGADEGTEDEEEAAAAASAGGDALRGNKDGDDGCCCCSAASGSPAAIACCCSPLLPLLRSIAEAAVSTGSRIVL